MLTLKFKSYEINIQLSTENEILAAATTKAKAIESGWNDNGYDKLYSTLLQKNLV